MGANLTFVNLGKGRTAKAIAAGDRHVAVILDDDTVRGWGDNRSGQCGRGDTATAIGSQPGEMGKSLIQVNLGTNRTAKAITAGAFHTCVLLDDNNVKCFGYNVYGQAGIVGGVDNQSVGDVPSDLGDGLPAIDFGTA